MSEPRIRETITSVVVYRSAEPADLVIVEGGCPSCDGLLERRERNGWCHTCDKGWSLAGDEVGVHLG